MSAARTHDGGPPRAGRRDALRGVARGAAALAGAAPAWPVREAVAATAGRAPTATGPRSAAGPRDAFASSFTAPAESLGPTRVRFDRRLPAGLAGTLYRNGPARMQRGATRYRHWFDGDGMVHSFAIAGDTLVHRARMVHTDRYRAEAAAGRFLWDGFGTTIAGARAPGSPDTLNVGNISVLPLGDELLALWEAGSAWRIDPATLATRGRKVFSPETDGLSFSAHPRVDPDGRIWNFGYRSGSGKLAIYDLERNGRLNRAVVVDAPNAEMVHDFAITERHLVFVLMPIRHAEGGARRAFVERLAWDAQGAVVVLLVEKATLAVSRRFELPAFFAFHFGNAWTEGDTVRVEAARSAPFAELMRAIGRATLGEPPGPLAREHAADLVLDLRAGHGRIESLPVAGAEFPRYDARFTGRATTRLVMLARAESMPEDAFGFNAVLALDRRRQQVRRFDYGAHTIAEEHVLVPARGGAEGTGWIVGTAYDWRAGRTMLSVFDAAAPDAGPIARASLPYRLPLGLHGQFVAL